MPDQESKDFGKTFMENINEIIAKAFPDLSTTQAPPFPTPNISLSSAWLETGHWLNIIKHPSVVLILGRRDSGKSALGYKILEYLRWTSQIYVVGFPQKSERLLPEWIGVLPSMEDVLPKSINLIDESYNLYHSRTSASEKAYILSNLINLSRQREQTLVFVTQEARQIDKNIVSSADIIVFKNPGIFQPEFERKELRKIAEEAKRMFMVIPTKEHVRWAYVYAPGNDYAGMAENSLPSFWTPKLSKAYAGTVQNKSHDIVIPKKLSLEERKMKARELQRQGFSLGQSATILGVSKSTVKNYLDGYPYRRKK